MLHLVDNMLRKGLKPVEAVRAALSQLRGAFALGFIFAGEDDLMIGARNGPPLAIGYGDGEMYLVRTRSRWRRSPIPSPISRTATGSC